jgi:hypothetical protein
MDAIKTVLSSDQDKFEHECNGLAEDGYLLQSCHCTVINPEVRGDYKTEPIWMAVFALRKFIQQASMPDEQPVE